MVKGTTTIFTIFDASIPALNIDRGDSEHTYATRRASPRRLQKKTKQRRVSSDPLPASLYHDRPPCSKAMITNL